jgi:hypothetical protein
MDETRDDGTPPDNVTHLADERKKRAKVKDRLSSGEIKLQIVLKMQRSPLAPMDWQEFPRMFRLVRDIAGRKTILEEHPDRVVCQVIDTVVIETIYNYCYTSLSMLPGADVTFRGAEDVMKLWAAMTLPLEEKPVSVSEKSYDGLTFKRLPFDAPAADIDPPPYFASFLSRCSQPEAVAAFLGSLLYPDADRQQYLFLYGPGQDGKSSIARFLLELLGDAVQSLQPKTAGDRFWNMKVYGKRLVMFTDCPDTPFFRSSEFKALTGNDPMYFEEKGRMGFTALPSCKVLVASNWRPDISGQKADLRRLIYAEMAPLPDGEAIVPNFDALLTGEAEDIVRYCKAVYERECPDHGAIPCELAHNVAAQNDEDDGSLFERYFEVDEGATMQGQVMSRVLDHAGIKNGREKKRLREVWGRMFGIRFRRGKQGNTYHGLRLRSDMSALIFFGGVRRGDGEVGGG